MIDTLLSAVGLGLAGVDPFGALVLLTAMPAGAPRARTAVFAGAVLVSSVLAGVVAATAGERPAEALPADSPPSRAPCGRSWS